MGPAGIGSADQTATRPLIAEPEAAAFAWFQRTRIYPFQNVVVVPNSLLEAHPRVAGELFDAFKQSTTAYLERLDRCVVLGGAELRQPARLSRQIRQSPRYYQARSADRGTAWR